MMDVRRLFAFYIGIFAVRFAVMVIIEYLFDYEHDPIWKAQHLEIGEGVNLSEGIRAYFGSESLWGRTDDRDVVQVVTGVGARRAGMLVHLDSKWVEVLNYWSGQCWEDCWVRNDLVNQMVKAAKNRRSLLRRK